MRVSGFYTFLLLALLTGCSSGSKKASAVDVGFQISKADTTADVKTIIAKVGTLVTVNKLEDATSYITLNLHRFKGLDKAALLNERGGAYFLKDDFDHAIADYLAAYDFDTTNATVIMNTARTYECMENLNNAKFFAVKIANTTTATDSDRVQAKELIIRCDRNHTR